MNSDYIQKPVACHTPRGPLLINAPQKKKKK